MTLPVPLLLLVGPLVAGVASAALRRRPRVAGVVGALLAFALWRWLVAAPAGADGGAAAPLLFAGDEWTLLGRVFLLTPGLRLLLGGLTVAVAVLCLLTVWIPQGAQFVPVLLLMLSPLAATLLVRPFAFGLVALVAATALMAVLIQGDRAGSTLAAMRFLALMGVAVPLVLAAEWMLASGQTALAASGSRLLLIGLIIWLAGFPAHIWLAPLLEEAPPLVTAVAAGLLQIVLVVLAQAIVVENTLLPVSAPFLSVLRLSGGAVIVVGGGLALLSRGAGRLLADLLLLDVGALLLVLGSAGDLSLVAPLVLLGGRFISLLLATTGLSLLRRGGRPNVRHMPAATVLYLVGALSLLGLPLTPGYFGRWTAVNIAAGESVWWAALLLLGSAAGVIGLLRWLNATWAADGAAISPTPQSLPGRVATLLLIGLGVALSLAPSVWVEPLLTLVSLL